MNFSKISLWLSVLIACLVLFASGSGILFTSTYAGETAPWVIQAIGQDIANLVTVLTLLIAVFFYGGNLNRSEVCFRQDKKLMRISVKFSLVAWAPFFF